MRLHIINLWFSSYFLRWFLNAKELPNCLLGGNPQRQRSQKWSQITSIFLKLYFIIFYYYIIIFYCLRFETPQTWRARSPYLYPSRNRVARLYPQALCSLFVPSTTHRATVEIFDLAFVRVCTQPAWFCLYSFGTDPSENTASIYPSIIVMGGCLATARISLTCLPAVTKQCMSLLEIVG
jgi:hypothetical protein